MNFLTAIILGIVEGITEFLPVSSTGHLMLASSLLQVPDSEFLKSFEIIIQLGAILSVVVLYWKSFVFNAAMFRKIFIAFIPTAVVGLVFYRIIKSYLLSSAGIVLWALFFGGVIMIIIEHYYSAKISDSKEVSDITYRQAFLIGLFQSIAIIPGVSRSAATILGGMLIGVDRKAIVEFSFLLAIPTMAAATGYDILKTSFSFTAVQFGYLCVGFIVSFLVAMASIRFLLAFIRTNNFVGFGIYRMLAAVALWFFLNFSGVAEK